MGARSLPSLWAGGLMPDELIPTYIAFCCREWIAPMGYRGGRCGICGERPEYLRPDPDSPVPIASTQSEGGDTHA